MSADEIEQRDRLERTRVEVLEALKGRWLRMLQLRDELPHIPYRKLKHQVQWLFEKGFLWRRELEGAGLTSTPVYEYRCRFM